MRNFYVLIFIICFGCLTSKGQRTLFTDNFGAYADGASLSENGSGWDTTGVSDFTNKKNETLGATETNKTNWFAQLATTGAASAYRVMELSAGNTYVFKAYLKTTNNKIYSTIRINVEGVDVVTSGNVSENYKWEELSIEYTPTVNETAKFVIQKTQAGVLNVDKVKIICSSCTNKNVVYDFHDSKEGWVVGQHCALSLGFDGMVVKATTNTPITRSGELSQNLDLNTADYNKAKIIFKTPYAMSGGGYGKLYLYDLDGGDSHFAIYDFDRDESNTTTFQTAEVDLTANGDYTGSIARIGVRAPWGIQNNQKFTIQRIELYNDIATSIAESKVSNYQAELYPNPTTNSITLNLDGVSNVNIDFMDVQGKLIFSKNSVRSHELINLSGISKGIYFVRILSDMGNQQIKVRIK